MTAQQQNTADVGINDAAYIIGGWAIDPTTLRIVHHDSTEKLEPKVMAVLEYLAARPGQVVSRQELEENVWAGTVVGYDAISNAIIKLRRAFGDDAHDARIIETIPKVGYRLIAPVESPAVQTGQSAVAGADSPGEAQAGSLTSTRLDPPGFSPRGWQVALGIVLPIVLAVVVGLLWFEPAKTRTEPASVERMAFPLPDKPSIAVLPFSNMSDDAQQEYFVDGMTEDLITDLSKLSGLFVVARNSVFTYKGKAVKVHQVAEELGVRYVLEGSVRRVGDNVRINAQLIDALSGGHVWADRYDGVIGDVFSLQDDVTRGIVEQLALNLSIENQNGIGRDEPTPGEVYDLFLKGWGYYRAGSARDYRSAVEIFGQVLDIDPGFKRAHAALAATHWNILVEGWWQESLGVHYYQAFELARKALRQSQQDPTVLTHQIASEWIVHFAKRNNNLPHRALSEAELALKLDPNHPGGHLALANALLQDNRPLEAEQSIRAAMRLDPHYPTAYLVRLAQARFQQARYRSASELLEQALGRNPKDSWAHLYLASAYGQLGLADKAHRALVKTNELRAEGGWGPVTILSVAHPDFRWQGDKDALKQGLRAAGAPVGGEWYPLITYVAQDKPPVVRGVSVIDASQARVLHERGAVFVATAATWLVSRIPGSHFLEWWGEGWQFNEVSLGRLASKDADIVIYDLEIRSKRAPQAAALAVSRGFDKVHLLAGGLDEWKVAGYPVEVPK